MIEDVKEELEGLSVRYKCNFFLNATVVGGSLLDCT